MKHIKLLSLAAVGALVFAVNAVAADDASTNSVANASTGTQKAAQYIDDATITTKVKTSLLTDKNTSGTDISVETMDGTVQLSGNAKSEQEKARAIELARQVEGVKDVKDNIKVGTN